MKSSLAYVVIALTAAIYGQQDEPIECDGGYCVSKASCPNGVYQGDPSYAQDAGIISLRIDDIDDCLDSLLVCCNTTLASNSDEVVEVPAPSPAYGQECGKNNMGGLYYNMESNETLAGYAEYPWVVYIFQTNKTSASTVFVSGGTLIHPSAVVTTAHNVDGKSDLTARFGEWDIGTNNEHFAQQDINVELINVHLDYQRKPIQNDIAILWLETAVQYQQHIQPICLPESGYVFDGQRCISNGWGKAGGVYAKIMKKITLPVVEHARCQRMLRRGGLGPFYRLSDKFMCAGGEIDVDTCKGDGGSPLACQQENGTFVLAGIVSWGIGCGGHELPGVYVAVSNYVGWIQSELNYLQEIESPGQS